jgi:hypothetical protein
VGQFLVSGGWATVGPAGLACALLVLRRPRSAALALPASLIAAQLLFAVLVGGDHMPASRFVMPVYPLLCALVAPLLEMAGRTLRLRWLPLPLGLALAALSFVTQSAALREHPLRYWLHRERPWWSYVVQTGFEGTYLESQQVVGQYLREHGKAGDLLAASECGVTPYHAGLHTLDLFGLNDRQVPRIFHNAFRLRRVAGDPQADEHAAAALGRGLARYVFARKPRWVVIDGYLDPQRGSFTPRLTMVWWLHAHPDWSLYRRVLSVPIRLGDRADVPRNWFNVIYERQPAPAPAVQDEAGQ